MHLFKLKRNVYITIITFLLVFLSSSFVVTNNIVPSSLTIALWLFVAFISVIIGNFKFINKIVILFLLISVLMLGTTLIRGENVVSLAKVLFSIFTVVIFVSSVRLEEFFGSFVRIIRALCVISLVGWALHLVAPGLFNIFIVRNEAGILFSNFVLFVQEVGTSFDASRNCGMMWEPGAFVTFILLAMIIEVFWNDGEVSIKHLLIYIATIISTFSTTGIISLLCMCAYIFFSKCQLSQKTKRRIFLLFLATFVVLLPFADLFFSTSMNSTFGKIISYVNSGGTLEGSTSIRVNSVVKGIDAFFESPFIGWGYNGLRQYTYQYTKGMNTCTFVNWFSTYGVLFGLLMTVGCKKISNKIAKSRDKLSFFIFLILFLITFTENYIHNPIVFLMVFYGYLQTDMQCNTGGMKNSSKNLLTF